ncbi:MAG: hypothetical protein ACUVV4_01040 [Candidatus Bathyarchaeia archaeon]
MINNHSYDFMLLAVKLLGSKPWILMYVGSVLSLVVCCLIVYLVTTTKNVSFEWIAWIFFGMGVVMIVGGFFTERRGKTGEFNFSKIS